MYKAGYYKLTQQDPGGEYSLNVKRGSGDGTYKANDVVKITSKKPSRFKQWKVISGNPKINNINSSSTNLIMPSENVVIKAIYSKKRGNDVGCGNLFKQQSDEDENDGEDDNEDE